jgi:putative FmdB family regulatory protein
MDPTLRGAAKILPMPIYEYQCTACQHGFEELVSMSAANPACPECGKPTEKQISGTNVGVPSNSPKKRVGKKAQKYAK